VPLVAGTLRGAGLTPVAETLSELRILAIAEGRASSEVMSSEEATQFLSETMARNLGYLFPSSGATEAERASDRYRASHERLFALLADRIGLDRVLGEVVAELEQILAQRPIAAWSVKRSIARATHLAEGLSGPLADRLRSWDEAVCGPTPLAEKFPTVAAYRRALPDVRRGGLEHEAERFAASMLETGLCSPLHAVLVRHLGERHADLVPVALGLDDAGRLAWEEHTDFVRSLVHGAVFATTAQGLLGLHQLLERSLLSRTEVAAVLARFVDLPIRATVEADLLAHRADDDDVSASAVLLSGVMAVLGQPLGIGQGRNPTCQAARGISLWAQHDPAHLLELVVAAARDGRVEMPFGNVMLRSDQLPQGVAATIDLDLDPVSIVLVPHLDRLYSEMMRRSLLRLEDAHKWVNPALYGRWVPHELATAFADLAQTTVSRFEAFVRRFFATHHPAYNGGYRLIYPNPVGLVITNHHGRYLGPHAVSIQRVDEDPDGEMRVYFFNPNDEGRQDWGHGVAPTVSNHGEEPGESSLPFGHFAARLYAFHYNPFEEGDLTAVPDELVSSVVAAARQSWGERFIWY